MNQGYFVSQIDRLKDVFGDRAFPDERVRLIWNAVQNLSDQFLRRTVDYFIGYEDRAPMMNKWDEQISKEREIVNRKEKQAHSQDAKEFASMYSGEDIATICDQIRLRCKSRMNDEHFSSFNQMLTGSYRFRCGKCEDTGAYFDKEFGGITACGSCLNRFGR